MLRALTVALAASTLAVLPACNTPKDRSESNLAEQAGTFQQRLQQMPAAIDNAVTRTLAATSGQNPKRADDFREFQKAIAALRDDAKLVAREADRATADSNAFFREWTREANRTTPADRPAIDEQIAARKVNRDRALGYLEEARKNYNQLVNDMLDIEKKLTGNLTEESILAVQPTVGDVIMRAKNVRNYVDRLDEQITAALAAQ